MILNRENNPWLYCKLISPAAAHSAQTWAKLSYLWPKTSLKKRVWFGKSRRRMQPNTPQVVFICLLMRQRLWLIWPSTLLAWNLLASKISAANSLALTKPCLPSTTSKPLLKLSAWSKQGFILIKSLTKDFKSPMRLVKCYRPHLFNI